MPDRSKPRGGTSSTLVTHLPADQPAAKSDRSASGTGSANSTSRLRLRVTTTGWRRASQRLDRPGDLADMLRRGAAAAAHGRRAQRHEPLGVLGQILGRAEVDLPISHLLGLAGVGLHDQRQFGQPGGLLDRAQQPVRPGAAVHAPGDRLPGLRRQRRQHARKRLARGRLAALEHRERDGKRHLRPGRHGRVQSLDRLARAAGSRT